MIRFVLALRIALAAVSFLLLGQAPCLSGDERPSVDGSYYGFRTHPRLAEAGTTDSSYVAPEIVDQIPPAPDGPIGPPEADAGLPPTVAPTFAPQRPVSGGQMPQWHLLPGDGLFPSYIAGVHAARMGGEIISDDDLGTLMDVTIGGRIAVMRYGTLGAQAEGVELQVYGAALSRLSMDRQSDVEATDYTFGVPLVYRTGPTAISFGYDHLSSHVGDEYLIRHPDFDRINYVRDSVELAVMQDVTDSVQVYGEANLALHRSGGAGRWHFQFGAEYEPVVAPGFGGGPVFAINTLLREEFNYQGSLGAVAGWQWRGMTSNDLLRLGLTLYTGKSRQFSFLNDYEKLFGVGLWYDF